MPSLDDNIEDLEPSADPNLDVQADTAAPAAKPAEANSSAATGETEDNDLLSVVRDVVGESKAKSQAASPAEGEEDEGQGAEPKKPDDENYEDVPFHKHPRFQHLLRKSKAFEQDAARYQNVQNFLEQAGLTGEEAADGLSVMGLAKTNPAEAWKQIKPWVQKLLIASGEVLPDDLRTRVQSGELSQEGAVEISRARATAASVTAAQTFEQQQRERREQTTLRTSLLTAAEDWERDRQIKDPNFSAKVEPLQKEIAFLQMKEGRPNTPEGVKDQLKRAYKAVNDQFRPPAPAPSQQRREIRPVTGGQVAGGQKPENVSTLDIVRANRRRA
ncbi:hypothetical protein [Aminobacter sp. BE322]|uniref:hypothetical protein n=1 Tax=unclassified Aminobacter TaxID=2644704 RepID=UPI003D20E49B